jgi:hypothetical protein
MIIRMLSVALLAICLFGATVPSIDGTGTKNAESRSPVSTLEGILKIHPKYLFKYYITGFGDGQECALFGEDKLKNIKVGSLIHVEGHLATRFHVGGSEKNPSPFGPTWYIFMDVETVRVLREPEVQTGGPANGSQAIPPETNRTSSAAGSGR